jgi:hypothetical protein
MTGLVLRSVVLAIVVFAAFVAVRLWERRGGRASPGLAPGITVVTGPHCRLCEPALDAIRTGGGEPDVVDIAQGRLVLGPISSLPVAVVASPDGTLVLRRSGRSVITDAGDIVRAAKRVEVHGAGGGR